MNRDRFRLFDRLDENLRHLLCEVRLAYGFIGSKPSEILEVDGEDMAIALGRLVEQIKDARDIAQQLRKTTGEK